MNILSLSGWIIIIAVISVVLRKYVPEYSMMINIAASIIVLSVILYEFLPAVNQIKNLLYNTKISHDYIVILFKSLGICFITQFASDSCSDAGERSLSSKVELAGKVAIIITALPLFEKVTNIALNLIGG